MLKQCLMGVTVAIGMSIGVSTPAQELTLDSSSQVGPSTSWFNGQLFASWKDSGPGGVLEYAVFDGSQWSLQQAIPGANSNFDPAIATFGTKLYVAWRGNGTDQRIWYSVFDGSHWSGQKQIPGAKSFGKPALSVANSKLYAVWKGDDSVFSGATFDGSTWTKIATPLRMPVAANSQPFSPQEIAQTALSGVDQGKYGDCVFEASVVAVASTEKGQASLAKAISQNADGSYTVTFPGDKEHPVKVTANQLITAQVKDKATWASILEAALIAGYPSFANGAHPPAYASKDPKVTGSPAIYALYLLTGNPAVKELASSTAIGEKITQALRNGQPVVAFCANNDDNTLISGHEWTVTSYVEKADRITLRNPWGNFQKAGTSKGGVNYDGDAEVSMTLQQFGKFYREVTFGYAKI